MILNSIFSACQILNCFFNLENHNRRNFFSKSLIFSWKFSRKIWNRTKIILKKSRFDSIDSVKTTKISILVLFEETWFCIKLFRKSHTLRKTSTKKKFETIGSEKFRFWNQVFATCQLLICSSFSDNDSLITIFKEWFFREAFCCFFTILYIVYLRHMESHSSFSHRHNWFHA